MGMGMNVTAHHPRRLPVTGVAMQASMHIYIYIYKNPIPLYTMG